MSNYASKYVLQKKWDCEQVPGVHEAVNPIILFHLSNNMFHLGKKQQ
jgi:hypothetical protein